MFKKGFEFLGFLIEALALFIYLINIAYLKVLVYHPRKIIYPFFGFLLFLFVTNDTPFLWVIVATGLEIITLISVQRLRSFSIEIKFHSSAQPIRLFLLTAVGLSIPYTIWVASMILQRT